MKTIILDANVAEADALKAVNVSLTVDFNNDAVMFNAKQAVPYHGRELLTQLDNTYNYRGQDKLPAFVNAPVEVQPKTEAKKVLADALLLAVQKAATKYLQGIYNLEHPVV